MKRKGAFSLIIVIVIIAMTVIFIKNRASNEDKIISFVMENQTELTNLAIEQLSGNTTISNYKDAQIDGVFTNSISESIVQFTYSANGIVSSSKYYGFYYSPTDSPTAFQNIDATLYADSDCWTWHEDNTDNGGITKRITDCWYYYEAWF